MLWLSWRRFGADVVAVGKFCNRVIGRSVVSCTVFKEIGVFIVKVMRYGRYFSCSRHCSNESIGHTIKLHTHVCLLLRKNCTMFFFLWFFHVLQNCVFWDVILDVLITLSTFRKIREKYLLAAGFSEILVPLCQTSRRYISTAMFFIITAINPEILHIYGLFNEVSGPGYSSDSLRAGRSGDRIPVGTRFYVPVQTGPGAHLTTCTKGAGPLSRRSSGRGVVLTIHPHLSSRLKKE